MPRGTFQYPHPHASTGSPATLAGSFGSVSCGVTASLLWVLVHPKFSLCHPSLESLSPLVLWKPVITSCWPSRPDSLGIPSPFVRSPGWEAWCGVQNFHKSVKTSLVSLFSSLWVTHPVGMGFYFVMIVPLLLSCCGFFFCLRTWSIFFWWVPESSCQWFFHS